MREAVSREKTLKIRGLTIDPPLLLAPMAGLTHSALRGLLVSLGGVGLLSTEMLAARALPGESVQTSPYLIRGSGERPLSCQILLAAEEEVEPAVTALHRYGADAIDLNLGCPAPIVRRSGGGSRLSESPDLVRRIVAAARRATALPLTAKLRLGETLDEGRLLDFCRLLEDEGIDMLTVHARLRAEKYGRRPRWEWIAKVKQGVGVPVIANGSIASVADARRCLEVTGADGLMIGRAAARSPWLFADLAREVYGADLPAVVRNWPLLYVRFAEALIERFPPERRLGRLKEFTHYYQENYPFGHRLASAVQASATMDEALGRAEEFFRRNDGAMDEAMAATALWPARLSVAGD